MGITIHYKGRAKSLEAIERLIEELKEAAETLEWDYERLLTKRLKENSILLGDMVLVIFQPKSRWQRKA